MGLLSAGMTHVGQKRSTNQDTIFVGKNENLFCVFDGMGGHKGGDVASGLGKDLFPRFFSEGLEGRDNSLEAASENLKNYHISLLKDSINRLNKSIIKKASSNENLDKMGTTITSLFFHSPYLFIGNVGDSRAYLIHNKLIFQLSKDHSLVQEKINQRIYSREQAHKDPMKNVLVRAIGFEDYVNADIFTYRFQRNDLFLICSDGLHGQVSDHDILHIINNGIPVPESATQEDLDEVTHQLVGQANKNGGQDNISAILLLVQ